MESDKVKLAADHKARRAWKARVEVALGTLGSMLDHVDAGRKQTRSRRSRASWSMISISEEKRRDSRTKSWVRSRNKSPRRSRIY